MNIGLLEESGCYMRCQRSRSTFSIQGDRWYFELHGKDASWAPRPGAQIPLVRTRLTEVSMLCIHGRFKTHCTCTLFERRSRVCLHGIQPLAGQSLASPLHFANPFKPLPLPITAFTNITALLGRSFFHLFPLASLTLLGTLLLLWFVGPLDATEN